MYNWYCWYFQYTRDRKTNLNAGATKKTPPLATTDFLVWSKNTKYKQSYINLSYEWIPWLSATSIFSNSGKCSNERDRETRRQVERERKISGRVELIFTNDEICRIFFFLLFLFPQFWTICNEKKCKGLSSETVICKGTNENSTHQN